MPTVRVLGVVGIVLLIAVGVGCSERPKPSDLELSGLIESYVTHTAPALETSKLHTFKMLNSYTKVIDSESCVVFDVVAFMYDDHAVREDGTLNLKGVRGLVACTKRGNQWYALSVTAPEAVEESYIPTPIEAKILADFQTRLAPLRTQLAQLKSKLNDYFLELDSLPTKLDPFHERNAYLRASEEPRVKSNAANEKAQQIGAEIEELRKSLFERIFNNKEGFKTTS
jgi:hypothetical protein